MKILDRLPFSDRGQTIIWHGIATIKPFQIVAWASLAAKGIVELDPGTPRIPVIIDTGHNHNLSIRQEHLARSGLPMVPRRGQVRIGEREVPILAANVWLYRNRPGQRDTSDSSPVLLTLDEGIAVYPEGMPNPARLPILGMRAIARNNLKLIVDGKRQIVTLKTEGWF